MRRTSKSTEPTPPPPPPCLSNGRPLVTRSAFASALRNGTIKSGAAAPVALRMTYRKALAEEAATEAAASTDPILRWIISADRPDRSRDIMEQGGFDFSEYNGVVLWAHASSGGGWFGGPPPPFPIGKSVNGFEIITLPNGHKATVASCLFALGCDWELAETAYKLAKAGFIPDTSVGITPIEFQETRDEKGYWIHFIRHYLDEWSLVPIGACYDVEMVSGAAKAAGIDLGPVKAWAGQLLDERSGLVSRSHLEAIAKVLGSGTKYLLPGLDDSTVKLALEGAAQIQRALEEEPEEEEDEPGAETQPVEDDGGEDPNAPELPEEEQEEEVAEGADEPEGDPDDEELEVVEDDEEPGTESEGGGDPGEDEEFELVEEEEPEAGEEEDEEDPLDPQGVTQ